MTESGKRLLEGLRLHGGHGTMFCDWRPEPHIAAIEAEAVAARNVEIAAAVEAYRLIEPNEPDYPGPYYDGWHAALDAVLTIVEGTP